MDPRPYPYGAWPQVDRAEADLLRRAAHLLPLAAPGRAAEAASALLGTEARVTPGALEHCPRGSLGECVSDPLVAVVLVPPDGSARARIAIEIAPSLAAAVIDRVLGGEGGAAAPVPVTPLDEGERGVLAYVMARLLVEADERPWRLGAILTTSAALCAALGDGAATVWPVTVAIGTDDRGIVRAWLPEAVLEAAPRGEPRVDAVRGVALELLVDAGHATLSVADLGSLRAGDVVVLDEAWAHPDAQGVRGEVRIRVAGARRTAWWCAIDPAGLRLRATETTAETKVGEGRRMSDDDRTGEALVQAGDAPVEVTVELARFRMPLEELGALRPGEIVATGRAIGERVTVRAGERAIAIGELVDVDGEVGVRLLRVGGQ